ncbi:hypothetical protein J6590_088445 [Homalodisca vitripennis]|nr:hypothetical protein J6590_088445 [Homalodisca vitripennis]
MAPFTPFLDKVVQQENLETLDAEGESRYNPPRKGSDSYHIWLLSPVLGAMTLDLTPILRFRLPESMMQKHVSYIDRIPDRTHS